MASEPPPSTANPAASHQDELRSLLARVERFIDDADDEGSPLLDEVRAMIERLTPAPAPGR